MITWYLQYLLHTFFVFRLFFKHSNGCWMLAFDRLVNAVFFGLQLKAAVPSVQGLAGNVNHETMFKIGIVSGVFTSMGPHRTTG